MSRLAESIRTEGIELALASPAGDIIQQELESWGEPNFVTTRVIQTNPLAIRFWLHYPRWSEELVYVEGASHLLPTVRIKLKFQGGIRQERKKD